MYPLLVVTLCLTSILPVSAWLPHDKPMQNLQGRSLFHTQYFENDTEIGHTKRWLPGRTPIRGVNLGSQFIIEPWMASSEWSNMGCGNAASEFDCVLALGQQRANEVWANHWSNWITQSDIQTMASYSLNTVRIPVGYWIFENIKYDSEHFPEGGLNHLGDIVNWAADQGFYIILDLHGAPFAQSPRQPFTGQYVNNIDESNPAFYQSSQFERAIWTVRNLTKLVHTDNRYRNVGMIELLNEPIGSNSLTDRMRSQYYPNAYDAIRNVENSLGVSANNYLHIQMMDTAWGSGDPHQYLHNDYFASYDDHNYIGFSGTNPDQGSYLAAACNERGGNWPLIVGEWSLHVKNENERDPQFYPVESQLGFYRSFFEKQARTYEKQTGWVYWSWKTDFGDPRWDYQAAVKAGVIPQNLDSMNANPC